MDIETAREYCLSKKAVTECFPFDEYSLVMKVMNKMFALIDLESANKICLKCDPEYALELREHYVAIEGAYHFNKKYWNQVFLDGDVDDKLLKQLIDHSVEEVLKKFTKKMRTEYEALPFYKAKGIYLFPQIHRRFSSLFRTNKAPMEYCCVRYHCLLYRQMP